MKIVDSIPGYGKRQLGKATKVRLKELAEFLESGAKYAELVVVEGTKLYTNVAAYNINLRRIGTKEAEHTKIVTRNNRIYAVRTDK